MGEIEQQIERVATSVAKRESSEANNNVKSLMQEIRDLFEETLDAQEKKQYYDSGLGDKLSTAITNAFTKLPTPKVSVNPEINVDLTPLNNLALEISNQNKNIISLLSKIGTGDSDDATDKQMYQLVVSMVQKNNQFVDRVFKEKDYSEPLSAIATALSQPNNNLVTWNCRVLERKLMNGVYVINEFELTPKINNK